LTVDVDQHVGLHDAIKTLSKLQMSANVGQCRPKSRGTTVSAAFGVALKGVAYQHTRSVDEQQVFPEREQVKIGSINLYKINMQQTPDKNAFWKKKRLPLLTSVFQKVNDIAST